MQRTYLNKIFHRFLGLFWPIFKPNSRGNIKTILPLEFGLKIGSKEPENQSKRFIEIGSKQICVTGLGNIGLPTACILAASGYAVQGVDIDSKVVARVQSATLALSEPNLQELLINAIQDGRLKVSTNTAPADIHIIVVPTLSLGKEPDISRVHSAINAIKPHLRSNDLVLIESTCPIGTTDAIAHGLRVNCPGIHVAYCPERVLPGQILNELIYNDRVVGGVDEASTQHAKAFYQSFIRGQVFTTNARTAEAVKLAENSYRDVNIAYANELSMIADRMDLNVNEMIRLANRHPRVQILNPGPGVGGNCITTNPWFLVSSAPDLAVLTAKAREINTQKTEWVIQKIKTTIKEKKANSIACLGITYKANVADSRESPALAIVQALEKETKVLCVDPYVPNTDPLYESLAHVEIVVGLVAHNEFLNIPSNCLFGKTILDFAGIFS